MRDHDEEQYDADYFESGIKSNYRGYEWRPELTLPRIRAIIEFVGIHPKAKILDYGCAKGFYVKALRELGYQADGLEISHYAISCAPDEVKPHISHLRRRPLSSIGELTYDLAIAKDVLEHLEKNDLLVTLRELRRVSKEVLVTVPVVNSQGEYINRDDRLDGTHKLRFSRQEWMKILQTATPKDSLCVALKGQNATGTLCAVMTHDTHAG